MRACYSGAVRALVLATILATVSPAVASEAADRTELIARIDDAVHAIATALDAHKLADATAHGREVRDMLGRLTALKGSDQRAADVLAHYPKYADAVDAAIAQLATVEQKVHRTDGLVARCAKDDAELHKLLKRRTDHPDPNPARDVDALATKADAYAATWSPVLTDLATVDHAIATEVANLALTDGYWMAVSNSVAAEAKAATDQWAEQYEAVTTACAPLGLGQHHADVAPVLEALRARLATDLTSATQLVHDYNAFLATVRTLRELALQGRTSLRDAICQATGGEVASRVGTVANTWGRDLEDRTTAVIAEANRLQANKRASKAIADGVRNAKAIATTIARDESKGRSNPRLGAVLAAIAKRREHGIATAKCVAKDVELTCGGTACRASCIAITDHVCTIVEPVPDQDGAKAAGFARAQHELEALVAWYTRDKAELFARVPVVKRCEIAARATLDLATDVVGYATCTGLTDAEFGEPLGDVPADFTE